MTKKVAFGAKPAPPQNADEWVTATTSGATANGELPTLGASAITGEIIPGADRTPKEPTKRLTIDVSANLHARIKSQCALRGTKMVDAISALLEEHFADVTA